MSEDAKPLIAIVDAVEPVVALIAAVLGDEGYRTVTFFPAYDAGPIAVAAFLAAHHPAACVFSLTVPFEESLELCRAVRRHLPTCPFVLTATDQRTVKDLLHDDEAIELIGKPFELEELVAAVGRAARDVTGADSQ